MPVLIIHMYIASFITTFHETWYQNIYLEPPAKKGFSKRDVNVC